VGTYNTFFEMFDVPFLSGPHFDRPMDDDHASVAVIGRKLNDMLFGGGDSVGKNIRLGDKFFKIIGVIDDWQPTPRFYHVDAGGAFADTEQIFIPMTRAIDEPLTPRGNTNCWAPMNEDVPVIEAFLQSECVWTQFWAELDTPEQAAAYKDYLDNYVRGQKEIGRFPRPLNTFISDVNEWLDVNGVVGDDSRVQLRLSFLFLMVCVLNTVGLLMAKFLGKSGEVALRRAMGASRSAIFSQNLVEIGVIGVLGGTVGIGLAWLGLRAVESLYHGYQHLVHLDPVMLVTAVGLSVVSAVAAGLFPVWRVSRLAPAGFLKTQ